MSEQINVQGGPPIEFALPLGDPTGDSATTPTDVEPGIADQLDELLADDGGGQGGEALSNFLEGLGEAVYEDGAIRWEPQGMSESQAAYFTASVDRLNALIRQGQLAVNSDGSIIAGEEA